MRTVWKYLVPYPGGPLVPLPEGAAVVGTGQDPETGEPAIWVDLDQSRPIHMRQIVAFSTGGQIPDNAVSLGLASCGPFRWHIFEVLG